MTTHQSYSWGIGINGFGRIGRLITRAALAKMKSNTSTDSKQLTIKAINDPFMTVEQMVYLFKHDSVHGNYPGEVSFRITKDGDYLLIDDQRIAVYSFKDASLIPWKSCRVDIVADNSGQYLTTDKAQVHILAGAKKVVLSAPPKDITTPILGTFIYNLIISNTNYV
jgi:glyceraldehyde 3-phosphate dehydrogenase